MPKNLLGNRAIRMCRSCDDGAPMAHCRYVNRRADVHVCRLRAHAGPLRSRPISQRSPDGVKLALNLKQSVVSYGVTNYLFGYQTNS